MKRTPTRDSQHATRRTLAGLALACVALVASGCGATRWVGLGKPSGASSTPSIATADPKPRKPAKPEERERNEKKSSRQVKEEFRLSDPLTEAKLRATEQPTEPWWPYRAGVLEAKAGHREASEASLRAALAREPGYGPALTALSRSLYAQGRHEEAVQLLAPVRDGAMTLDDDDRSAAIAGLALHEVALGRDDRANAAMGSLGRVHGDQVLGVAGYLAVRGTSAKAAIEATEDAVRAAPRSAANHNNRGIALLRSADPDAAEKAFERAIELDPSLPGPYYNLAILEHYYRLDTPKATKRFQQYWSRSQADPDSLFGELGRGRPAPMADDGSPR